jgi:hypothetical protein
MIVRQEVTSKTGKRFFIYQENGIFVSKEKYEAQQNMETKSKKRRNKKSKEVLQETFPELEPVINQVESLSAEEAISNLDRQEEWQGETGTFGINIKTEDGVKETSFDEFYKQGVIDFEKSIEEAMEESVPKEVVIQEKLKEPVKVRGFFSTWFKKWSW